ncbi:MAG TPA: MoaD/ThiS family protein [Burkholderiaceae bacterium]|jgi:molybdopterin synthase sulfur carrier subunit|nr:MoaD/ThiS family protein [Burkholderiaceae bacterium]
MTAQATIRVRYFAALREALGAGESLQLAADATVAQARDALIARSPLHAELLARGRAVRTALDQTLCDESAPVGDGAELAFFPPVTGG